jgi:asparagine synthase (glutamine-hydrolysing)
MCGIAGIYAYHPAADNVDRAELTRIRDHMAARGPDGSGAWFSQNGRVGFGHRRLSIIDLSDRGAQPMESADGKLIITFNGEIYNYRTLRTELEAEGYIFRTQSDTEVLLHLYAARGAAMVNDLRGMFAFGIWDREKGGLLLARDPYGIKPLYYADDGRTLRFASQVKALIAGAKVSRDPEPAGWVGFHIFGSVPEPFTIYRAIHLLPAGSTIWVDSQGVTEPVPYFRISETYQSAEHDRPVLSASELHERIRTALFDSVRHHMVADVPVGVFLSSGLDSGALLGLMRDVAQQDIQAITLTYDEYKNSHEDEAPLAAKCAAQYGSKHTIRVVQEQEFHDDLPRIFEAMDQPTIDGINTWFVSKAARELGLKAAISGLGGDELFGGYPSFRDIPRWVRMWAIPSRIPLLGDAFRYFAAASGLASVLNPKVAGLLKFSGSFAGAYLLRRGLFMPWELGSLMDKDIVSEGLRRLEPVRHINKVLEPMPRTNFAKVASLEASLYMRNQLLRDADWASMAHSLEIRVPLVDAHLLRAVAPVVTALPIGAGKRNLAASPRLPLPADVVDRPKTGFGTPVKDWLQRDDRLQRWRHVPSLAKPRCPWARRWAYQLAAA